MVEQTDIAGLIRYSVGWRGPDKPICRPEADGYWTPWHEAATALAELSAKLVDVEGERDEARQIVEYAKTENEKNLAAIEERQAAYEATYAALATATARIAEMEAALRRIAEKDTDGLESYTPQAMQSIARQALCRAS